MSLPTPYYQEEGITIYHGDCREILPDLEAGSIRLLWTDPPYGHGNNCGDLNESLSKSRGSVATPIANDTPEEFRQVMDGMLTEAVRVLSDDCCCCCCCCGGGGPRPTFAWVANRMDGQGLSFFHSVIWDKINPGLGWRYRRQHEMVMVAHKKGGKLSWVDSGRAVGNVIKQSAPANRVHPNEKPLEIPSLFISLHTNPEDTILDPFMGSGTTLRAAKDLGRKAIGIELEEKYCAIAVERLRQEVLAL